MPLTFPPCRSHRRDGWKCLTRRGTFRSHMNETAGRRSLQYRPTVVGGSAGRAPGRQTTNIPGEVQTIPTRPRQLIIPGPQSNCTEIPAQRRAGNTARESGRQSYRLPGVFIGDTDSDGWRVRHPPRIRALTAREMTIDASLGDDDHAAIGPSRDPGHVITGPNGRP